jgi:hypothetical protein
VAVTGTTPDKVTTDKHQGNRVKQCVTRG